MEKKQSAGGVWYMLSNETGTWYVFKRCVNYDGKMHGGQAASWRYVHKGRDEIEARKAFDTRLASKATK